MFGLQWHGITMPHSSHLTLADHLARLFLDIGRWTIRWTMAATWWLVFLSQPLGGSWGFDLPKVDMFWKKTAVVFTMFRCKTQGKKWKTPRIPCIIWNNTEARDIDHQQNMGEWEPQKYHSLSMWDYDTRLFYIFTPAIADKKWGIIKQLELMNTKTSDMPVFIRQPPFDILRCWSIWPEPIHWLSSRSPSESLANFATKSFLAKDSGHWIPNGHAFLCTWTF